ncbi:hypothetical protein KKF64_01125 [Patescibacteria group bacterium]|nr:hypothetical protein [Patescibacteria group bacterium]
MIAKITPLTRLPSKVDSFDYFVPDELREKIQIGQLVIIPWRNKKTTGVVLSLQNKKSPPLPEGRIKVGKEKFRARPVTEILHDRPVLTDQQFKLIKKFSDYYFCSQGYVARKIAPEPLRKSSKSGAILKFHEQINFSIRKNQISELKKAGTKITKKVEHIKIQDVSSFVWLILHLMKHAQGQVLVLFPTIDMINAVASVVQKKCSTNFAIIHSELSKGNYWKEYQKILSNNAKIILSTRQGVFLPIQKRGKIIFFESTSQDFKQYDQHPRYDARVVASWVSDITDSDLIFASASIWLNHKHTDLPPASDARASIKLVDMKTEMQKKNFSIIADSTLDAINGAIQNNRKVLIISLREQSDQGVSVNKLAETLTNQIKNCKIATKYGSNQDFNILVTTAYPLEALKLTQERRKFSLAVFSSIEPLLAIPDFRSGQRTFNRLNFWKIMCSELQIKRIILQSYSPENLAVRAFAYGETDVFIKSEMQNRKQFNYPPFSQLIKLSYQGNIGYEFDRALKSLQPALKNKAQILGPFKDKKNQQSLLLKVARHTDLSIICSLPHGWLVDRDPENVL